MDTWEMNFDWVEVQLHDVCILNPYNLRKLLLIEQLVHEQQKTYIVIVSLSFLQGY
jgi:hypothetical protein